MLGRGKIANQKRTGIGREEQTKTFNNPTLVRRKSD
jgi:hypothetical protein